MKIIISILKLIKRHGPSILFDSALKLRLKSIDSLISKNSILRYDYSDDVFIGKGVYIGDYSLLAAKTARPGSHDSTIVIGDNVFIGEFNNIRATGGHIVIGNYCNISQNCSFIASNHSVSKDSPIALQEWDYSKTGIVLNDDVWIGANSVILPGVEIGKGAVIGAGAVVTKNIPEYAIAVGNPAKVIRYRM